MDGFQALAYMRRTEHRSSTVSRRSRLFTRWGKLGPSSAGGIGEPFHAQTKEF
jgi:hypothetical protein